MIRYLPVEVVLRIIDAERIGPVRDEGLLQSALDRPATTVLGADAYPELPAKAAALMHSLCLNHALVDGNKRIAAVCAVVFLEVNGSTSGLDNDGLFDLTMAVAEGSIRDVDEIAARLDVREL
ncbi:type II toxin-antitoxin system death-on-curing family toxin [Demequina salsinemoris]|uniref:type II toxin-antitoxin system death-on-curing family toxin n=1 Tax=Demequina salsinemoris TaxID=577470 RepID=UPI00078201C6|nr:Fic family protein [Demequina salsinemoris]